MKQQLAYGYIKNQKTYGIQAFFAIFPHIWWLNSPFYIINAQDENMTITFELYPAKSVSFIFHVGDSFRRYPIVEEEWLGRPFTTVMSDIGFLCDH